MERKHIGKIIFYSGKKKYSGTGNVVYIDSKKIIIATAAHCVYDHAQNVFYDNISFYTDNVKKKVQIDKIFINKAWVESSDLNSDYAFLTIYKKSTNANFINNLDYTPPLFEMGRGENYSIYGIPNKLIFKEKVKSFFGYAIQDVYRDSSMQGVEARAEVGMSGGPWLLNIDGKKYQNSNISATFNEAEGILWGPYWGKECKTVYESSLNENVMSNLVIEHEGGIINE